MPWKREPLPALGARLGCQGKRIGRDAGCRMCMASSVEAPGVGTAGILIQRTLYDPGGKGSRGQRLGGGLAADDMRARPGMPAILCLRGSRPYHIHGTRALRPGG